MYTPLLTSIDLENNIIDYIEANSFCNLKFIKRLKLSHNKLKFVSIYCLENVTFLHLSNVEFEGEIDQKRIGNPINALILDLSHNKIKKISLNKMYRLKELRFDFGHNSSFSKFDRIGYFEKQIYRENFRKI